MGGKKQLVLLKRYVRLAPGHLTFRAEGGGTPSGMGIWACA